MDKFKSVTNIERLTYGLGELSSMIGVSKAFLRLEILRGKLKPRRLGRRVLIPKEEVYRYLGVADEHAKH